jgi:pimeloyl-ACP methyl ester carboxylesterase
MRNPERIHRGLILAIASTISLFNPTRAPAEWPKFDSFDSKGVNIAYMTQGQGEPVIFIHGWLSSAGINWMLPGITGAVAKEHRIVAFDVRGHGRSDKPTKEEAYGEELVDDVARLMDHLKLKQAHIVGYSMGGIIGARFMVKYPNRVLSGTLGGMGWMKDGGWGQWGFNQIGKNEKNAPAFSLCGKSLGKLALSEKEIKSIKVPVCVIVGENDHLIKGLYIEELEKARPDWPVTRVKDADHLSCVIKPQFKDEIVKWLKKSSKE